MTDPLFDLIKAARESLFSVVSPTPLIYSSSLSDLFGFECLLKLENLQKTGSFKVRGAYNRVLAMTEEERAPGVVTASMGNHAQGVAWAAALLGVPSVVVMPEKASIVKQVSTRGYGAEIRIEGATLAEAMEAARALERDRGMVLVHPYDDELVMAGQGTIGLEIMDECPGVDTVVVPVGGGGLISGIAAAVKGASPGVRVMGVEAAASASLKASFEAGRPTGVEKGHTIADGIAVKRVGEKPFAVIRRLVDGVVAVGEDSIAGGILTLLERKKLVVEGSGAVPVAAAMEGLLPPDARKVVMVLSGGNIDVNVLDRIIRLGLIREGRVVRLATTLADEPGSLARLTADIAGLRGNILHIVHQRDSVGAPVGTARLEAVVEVEGPEHGRRLTDGLRDRGYEVSEGG